MCFEVKESEISARANSVLCTFCGTPFESRFMERRVMLSVFLSNSILLFYGSLLK